MFAYAKISNEQDVFSKRREKVEEDESELPRMPRECRRYPHVRNPVWGRHTRQRNIYGLSGGVPTDSDLQPVPALLGPFDGCG